MDSLSYIPGINPNDLNTIIEHFKVKNISHLKKLAKKQEIRSLKGFNNKTEMKILRGIKLLENQSKVMPIGIALDFVTLFINELQAWPQICRVLLVGELRRGVEEVKNIELMVEADIQELLDIIQQSSLVKLHKEIDNKIELHTILGLPLFIHISTRNAWGTNSIFYTGSTQHVKALLNISGSLPNLPWIAPEIRESGYEVQFAKEKLIPNLIELKEIKGDLHIHSQWSDGANTIEEILIAAINKGYEYLAITDHSQSLKVAGGIGPRDILRQIREINELQVKFPQIRILKGIEVDILVDGSLDLPNDVLNNLDIVIASIHSHFHMSEKEMTQRIIEALKHPLVHILAHPTGRVLGKRPGYKVDIKEVITIAQRYNKVLEINASPDRLDLGDQHLQMARIKGVKIAINTDAHQIEKLKDMSYGVQMAKRGWQTSKEIINSWSYEKLISFLNNRGGL